MTRSFPYALGPRRASVLVGMLWCVALLALLVVGVLYGSRLDLRVVKNHGDLIQAHYLALAGIEKAKALLFHDAADRRRAGQNHTGELYDAPHYFQDVAFGRGQFRVFRPGRADEARGLVFGIDDEESRLNINHASSEQLGKLYGATPAMVAKIIDYRDSDQTVTTGGAEAAEYASLRPPYIPRDGPFRTTRELLMVMGLSREIVFGEDFNQNGLLDPEEDDGSEFPPADNSDGLLDTGWSSIITAHSSVQNLSAKGAQRVNIQDADATSLGMISGISETVANAIVQYRNQNRFEAVVDLLQVTAPTASRAPSPGPDAQARSQPGAQNASRPGRPAPVQGPQAGQINPPAQAPTSSSGSGQKLISQQLLMDIADDLTTESDTELPGVVNINTAPIEVLICLPGMTHELAQAMVNYRASSGFFQNTAWLLKVPGMNEQMLKQLSPRISTRSETFRISSEGRVGSTGARKGLQVVIRVTEYGVDTLAYREDL